MNNNSGMKKASPLHLLLLWTCLAFAAVATPLSAQNIEIQVTPEEITTSFEAKTIDENFSIVNKRVVVQITVGDPTPGAEDEGDWEWSSDKDWLTTDEALIIRGTTSFTIILEENDSGDTRAGTFTFTSLTDAQKIARLEVIQLAEAPVSLPDEVQSSDNSEQTRDVEVVTDTPGRDWVWDSSSKDWLTSDADATLTGSQTFTYKLAANNTGASREATLTFDPAEGVPGDRTVLKVIQFGAASVTLDLTDKDQATSFEASGVPEKPHRQVSVLSNTQWTWESDSSWLFGVDEPLEQSEDNDFTYGVAANTTGETREGILTFRSKSGGLVQQLKVTQTADGSGIDTLELGASTFTIGQAGEELDSSSPEFIVDSNTAWNWNRDDIPAWFLSEEAEEQEDSRNFSFGATANTTGKARSFVLIFKAGTLERRVEVTQEGRLSVSDTVQTNTAAEQTRDFQVFAAEGSSWLWSSSDPGWLNGDDEASTQEGSKTFTYRVKANDSNQQRSGTLTFTSKVGSETATLVINQLPGGEPGGNFLIVTESQQATDFNAKDALQVSLETNTPWTWGSSESWLSSGEPTTQDGGNKIFVYQVAENTSGATRTGQLTFRSTSGGIVQTVEVTQTGNAVDKEGSLTLSNTIQTIISAQQTRTVEVFAAEKLSWVWASSDPGWLTSLGEALEQTGRQTFSYRVSANDTGQLRSATLTFFYQDSEETATLVVKQLPIGETGDPIFSLSDAEQSTDSNAKANLSVEVTATGGVQWEWQSSESWLTSDEDATLTGTGSPETFNYAVAENTSTSARTGTFTFTAGDITLTLTVTQAAAAASTSISPATEIVANSGASYDIAVSSNTSWTAASDQSWATASPVSGSNNGAVTVTVAANTATTSRVATITIGGETHTLTQDAATGPTGPGADAPANDIPEKFQPKSPNEPALRLAVPAGKSRTVIARGANGTEGIALIEFFALGDGDSSGTATLDNLSTRGNIGTGDNVLIAGIVIQGSGTKRVLVTGRGASVPVAGNIANTQLRVVNQATKDTIATSDDYASEPGNTRIRAAGKAPTIADNDAAVILDLPAGAYTAIVRGVGGAAGVGIVEIFDIEPDSTAKIINLSTRGRVGTGDNVMIGGLIAGGKSGEFAGVITRVTSPSSAAYEPGKWLADPNITVFDGPNKVLENDNWTTP